MKISNKLQQELRAHVADHIDDLIDAEIDDLHHYLFNEDHYLIGYYQCEQWLKKHEISAFEAIEYVQEYERETFGETSTEINSESIVNMFTYIVGEKVLFNCLHDLDITEGLLTRDQAEAIKGYLAE